MRPLDGPIPNVTSVLKRSNKYVQGDSGHAHTQKEHILNTIYIEGPGKRGVLTKVY